jgi:hypothetical protein
MYFLVQSVYMLLCRTAMATADRLLTRVRGEFPYIIGCSLEDPRLETEECEQFTLFVH